MNRSYWSRLSYLRLLLLHRVLFSLQHFSYVWRCCHIDIFHKIWHRLTTFFHHEQGHWLYFPELNWWYITFFSVNFGINYIVNNSLLLKELTIVQKVYAREYSLKEPSPFHLVICVFHCSSFVLAYALEEWAGLGATLWGIGRLHVGVNHCFLVEFLNHLDLYLMTVCFVKVWWSLWCYWKPFLH